MKKFHQISLVVVAVVALCGYSLRLSAQQLKAENIDEVIKAMTLEEKCHMVLGRGMHFNDVEAKASANVKAWTQKVNKVMKPNVKLNLLKR